MNKENKGAKNNIFLDERKNIVINPPEDFRFNECLIFLGRSNNEVLHSVVDHSFIKLMKINNEMVLIRVYEENGNLLIEFQNQPSNVEIKLQAASYIWDLFDLDRDLTHFYELGKKDDLLDSLIEKYYGLRLIGIPDLFEALCWAIMGQQINLTFAYTLKRRFVEKYGEKFSWHDEVYFLFPNPNVIAKLEISDLTSLQFTQRKAEYVIGIAKLMSDGNLSKELIIDSGDYAQKCKHLISIRGIGNWTADYVLMKCLKERVAFPIADVGIHNALKIQLALNKKPTIEEIKELAKNWVGWEAYVTFYLWRSLYS
ncbi:DNA-3-methyladenine glycosylase 2 [Bacillus sp. JJ664]